jgi:hypothetical protein
MIRALALIGASSKNNKNANASNNTNNKLSKKRRTHASAKPPGKALRRQSGVTSGELCYTLPLHVIRR